MTCSNYSPGRCYGSATTLLRVFITRRRSLVAVVAGVAGRSANARPSPNKTTTLHLFERPRLHAGDFFVRHTSLITYA